MCLSLVRSRKKEEDRRGRRNLEATAKEEGNQDTPFFRSTLPVKRLSKNRPLPAMISVLFPLSLSKNVTAKIPVV
jgi:hypothetical protein